MERSVTDLTDDARRALAAGERQRLTDAARTVARENAKRAAAARRHVPTDAAERVAMAAADTDALDTLDTAARRHVARHAATSGTAHADDAASGAQGRYVREVARVVERAAAACAAVGVWCDLAAVATVAAADLATPRRLAAYAATAARTAASRAAERAARERPLATHDADTDTGDADTDADGSPRDTDGAGDTLTLDATAARLIARADAFTAGDLYAVSARDTAVATDLARAVLARRGTVTLTDGRTVAVDTLTALTMRGLSRTPTVGHADALTMRPSDAASAVEVARLTAAVALDAASADWFPACGRCNGTGETRRNRGKRVEVGACRTCGGSGVSSHTGGTWAAVCAAGESATVTVPPTVLYGATCGVCDGHGRTRRPCDACRGRGSRVRRVRRACGVCPTCRGGGVSPLAHVSQKCEQTCQTCRGTGEVGGRVVTLPAVACGTCEGTGDLYGTCHACHGRGRTDGGGVWHDGTRFRGLTFADLALRAVTCRTCGGGGTDDTDDTDDAGECETCGGTGEVAPYRGEQLRQTRGGSGRRVGALKSPRHVAAADLAHVARLDATDGTTRKRVGDAVGQYGAEVARRAAVLDPRRRPCPACHGAGDDALTVAIGAAASSLFGRRPPAHLLYAVACHACEGTGEVGAGEVGALASPDATPALDARRAVTRADDAAAAVNRERAVTARADVFARLAVRPPWRRAADLALYGTGDALTLTPTLSPVEHGGRVLAGGTTDAAHALYDTHAAAAATARQTALDARLAAADAMARSAAARLTLDTLTDAARHAHGTPLAAAVLAAFVTATRHATHAADTARRHADAATDTAARAARAHAATGDAWAAAVERDTARDLAHGRAAYVTAAARGLAALAAAV